MNERPKSIWWAWSAVLVFLLVVYPLSIGPAFWLLDAAHARWGSSAEWLRPVVGLIYLPVILAGSIGPEWLQKAFEQYVMWWGGGMF